MAAAADLDEIKEINVSCILMANLQQSSTSITQTNSAPVYDSDGSAEVHNYEICYDNEIFNMFTQEEQYTKLLEPILEPQQVPQNNNNVIFEVTSMEQSGETVEQHFVNFEETRALYDSLYQNLAIKVEKLSKEKSTVSFLLEENKKLKSDFKTCEDGLLDKQIQLEKKGIVQTEMELVLEQTQQGYSHEVSVSTEGVEELKRIDQTMALQPHSSGVKIQDPMLDRQR
nr:hypothetical protein [Tanacetum cinerariifolium]